MAYFDNAATSFPKPEIVYSFMDSFYRNCGGSVGRGNYALANNARNIVEETRLLIQTLLHCPTKQVVFTPTATIALNIIIQGIISSGVRHVYISPFEHNAVTRVLYHFEELGQIIVHELNVTNSLEYDIERISYQFDANSPELVIVSHASNVIGLVSPVETIFKLSKKYNAITVADMSQTAGIIDTNVGLETFDFAVFAGHKTLLGPTGISGFVMKPEFDLPPAFFGGTGYDSANQEMPNSLPEKFEFGTLNILGVAGLNAALKWILKEKVDNLYARELKNRSQLLDLLNKYDYFTIIGDLDQQRYVGIVSCLIKNISSESAGPLFSERGIAVRTGLHCAPKAHKFLGTYPSGTIRFSVGPFTSKTDFDDLEQSLDYFEENLE